MSDVSEAPVRIGVSTCLLGESVRHDGGHKHDRLLTETLGAFVEWVPVCPEVELGMGVPREPIHLLEEAGAVRLVGVRSGHDHTAAMRAWARRRAASLARENLSGYVLKKDSPSCGLERVRLHHPDRQATRDGRGLFAEALLDRLPGLPVEEEGRLRDPGLRENWIERIFAYRRLRDLFAGRWTTAGLVAFHTAHKLTLLAHTPVAYRELGRLVASGGGRPRKELREEYERGFLAAMSRIATRPRHTNVLEHMAGYFRRTLDDDARRELAGLIGDYRAGLVPLIVPVTLVAHHARRLRAAYLLGQTYLSPHPKELALRNHV